MSTILKALRRLEEDRGVQSPRPLRDEVTRSPESAKSRRRGRPLLAVLLGLGVAAGTGALAFWYMGGAPEPAGPTEPKELAAAGSAEPRAEPAAAAKRPRKPRRARPALQRPSPPRAAAPSAASERELPAAALESKVGLVRRPPAQPRIAASEPADPPGGAVGAEEPAGSQVTPAGPVQQASRRAPAATGPEETKFRAEQPPEQAAEPPVVAVAPRPERAAPEPPVASGAAPARDAEKTAPTPKPVHEEAAAEEASKQPTKAAAAVARESEPGEAASSQIVRAEVPGLRVERTVWHPIAERRVATIELEQNSERREIHEGDAVGPLVVSEIEPSGVVFVHEGVEIRRRIGE